MHMFTLIRDLPNRYNNEIQLIGLSRRDKNDVKQVFGLFRKSVLDYFYCSESPKMLNT